MKRKFQKLDGDTCRISPPKISFWQILVVKSYVEPDTDGFCLVQFCLVFLLGYQMFRHRLQISKLKVLI